MSALLSQFEIEKGRMPPLLRHEYRDRFLRLATRLSDQAYATAITLAHTAFKLSEGNISVGYTEWRFLIELLQTAVEDTTNIQVYKTALQLALEAALMDNKKTVLRLQENRLATSNTNVTLDSLRREANRLTEALTTEIRCEQRTLACNRIRTCK
jgi:hypothetical protein